MKTTGFTARFADGDIGEVNVEDEGHFIILEQDGEQVWIPRDEFAEYVGALRKWADENVDNKSSDRWSV